MARASSPPVACLAVVLACCLAAAVSAQDYEFGQATWYDSISNGACAPRWQLQRWGGNLFRILAAHKRTGLTHARALLPVSALLLPQ